MMFRTRTVNRCRLTNWQDEKSTVADKVMRKNGLTKNIKGNVKSAGNFGLFWLEWREREPTSTRVLVSEASSSY